MSCLVGLETGAICAPGKLRQVAENRRGALFDGKRRHARALETYANALASGSGPVDISEISSLETSDMAINNIAILWRHSRRHAAFLEQQKSRRLAQHVASSLASSP